MPIRWCAEYKYHDYFFKIRTTLDADAWHIAESFCTEGGAKITADRIGYELKPDEFSQALHGERVEEYIKQLRDAKDIAEYVMANIEHLQKGEIVY